MPSMENNGLWLQFGASIDMLENAIRKCPEDLWKGDSPGEGVWYLCFHTLFWTDLYLSGAVEDFHPPEPYGLEELDPTGALPDRIYSKPELLTYLSHCRDKGKEFILGMGEEEASRECTFGWGTATYFELHMYNMRHIQHGAAQINLLLRQEIDDSPGWVAQTKH